MSAPSFWNRRGGGREDEESAPGATTRTSATPTRSTTTAPTPTAATATNLRWRARIAKEAMAFPFDDSSTVAYDDHDESKLLIKSAPSEASTLRRCCFGSYCRIWRPLLRRGIKPVVIPACVAGAVASSLYALTVSTHVVVALASALTVATSVIVLIQQRMLHSGGSVQKHHVVNQTHALHNLQVEKERLYRLVLQLDETAERRRDVQRQVQAHITKMTAEEKTNPPPAENAATGSQRRANVSNDDVASAIRIAASYKQTQAQLLEQSQHELVVRISQAMVEPLMMSDGDRVAAANVSLMADLGKLPGVACDENLVKQLLNESGASAGPDDDASSSSASPVVVGYVNLLRQALMDGELAAIISGDPSSVGSDGQPLLPGTPQRRKRRLVRAQLQQQQQQRKQLSAVFVFDPDKRLRGSSSGDEAAVST